MDVKLSRRWLVTAGAVLLAVPTARGVERDNLLEEVRALRRDLHAAAVVAQRIQLLVYRVYAQTEVVRRFKSRYEQAKRERDYLEFRTANSPGNLNQFEESIRAETDRARRASLELELKRQKAYQQEEVARLVNLQTEASTAQRDLGLEQAKLDDLQSRLDLLERQLEGLSASLVR